MKSVFAKCSGLFCLGRFQNRLGGHRLLLDASLYPPSGAIRAILSQKVATPILISVPVRPTKVRLLQNLVSARPWPSAASPQASSALRMQRRRTKPLRGGPTAPSPMGIESPDPMPREPPGGVLGVTQRSSWRLGDVAMKSAGVAIQGVPVPPVEGGRSRTRV